MEDYTLNSKTIELVLKNDYKYLKKGLRISLEMYGNEKSLPSMGKLFLVLEKENFIVPPNGLHINQFDILFYTKLDLED